MQDDFLKGYLEAHFGLEILIPGLADQDRINSIIFEELCLGQFKDVSRGFFQGCIEKLKDQGAECVILGCTEIPMLIKAEDACLPSIDTTTLHGQIGCGTGPGRLKQTTRGRFQNQRPFFERRAWVGPRELQPLAELQYRGVFWVQHNQ